MSQSAGENAPKKRNLLNAAIDGISGVFLPLIHLLSAGGILKGLVAVFTVFGVLQEGQGTHTVLSAMGDAVFYFLPVLLAYTAATRFGANPFTSVAIAGILLYPQLTQLFDAGESLSLFGLPVTPGKYPYSVIPIILAVLLQSYAEKLFKRFLPGVIRDIATPLLSLFVVGGLTLLLLGPAGRIAGDGIAAGYTFVYGLSPLLAGLLIGASIQILSIFGFQWGLLAIAINNIAVLGSDTILILMSPPVCAQIGAALAVMIKTKDKAFRGTCLTAIITAFFGITEPIMFGVNMPLKKPLVAVCVAGGVGSAIAGLSGARAFSFAFPGFMALPVSIGSGFGLFVVACLAATALAFVLSLVLRYEAVPPGKAQAEAA